jgi:hypothetical protein
VIEKSDEFLAVPRVSRSIEDCGVVELSCRPFLGSPTRAEYLRVNSC